MGKLKFEIGSQYFIIFILIMLSLGGLQYSVVFYYRVSRILNAYSSLNFLIYFLSHYLVVFKLVSDDGTIDGDEHYSFRSLSLSLLYFVLSAIHVTTPVYRFAYWRLCRWRKLWLTIQEMALYQLHTRSLVFPLNSIQFQRFGKPFVSRRSIRSQQYPPTHRPF
jgi:hypothetical protein